MNARPMFLVTARSLTAGLAAALVLSTTASKSNAQTPAARFVDSARVMIDHAVGAMDPDALDQATVLLDRALVAFPDDPYLLHYRGYAAYWKATGAFMGGQKEGAIPFITQALADLKTSAEHLAWPETTQLEANLNGYLIAIDPGNGPTLGPLTGRLSGEATKMGPNNPRVLLLQAYLAQATPESMGGGVARAKELVSNALAAFATDHPAPLAPAWGRAEAEALQRRLGPSEPRGNR
jgi:hypothetical protein